MKKIIFSIFTVLIICSCTNYGEEQSSFTGRSYRLINIEIFNDPIEYSHWEFLDNGKLIGEAKWDSMVVQQINYWEYFRKGKNEFLVLEELAEMLDTFKLIRNDNFTYFEFINKKGDTLKIEEFIEESNFDSSLIFNTRWININDSVYIGGYDSIYNNFIRGNPEYQFFDNYEYSIKYPGTKTGKWKFSPNRNKIYLDSLKNNNEIIKLKKLTEDSLIFWKRDFRQNPKLMKCIKRNSV